MEFKWLWFSWSFSDCFTIQNKLKYMLLCTKMHHSTNKNMKTNSHIQFIQIPKNIYPRIRRRWNNLKTNFFKGATASISHQKYVFLSPHSQTNFLNCFEKVPLVFIMGLFKVTKNAPAMWQSNIRKTDDKLKQLLIQSTLAPFLPK